jgi:hypothetical protein
LKPQKIESKSWVFIILLFIVSDGIDNQKAFLNAALQDVIAFFESDEFKMYVIVI